MNTLTLEKKAIWQHDCDVPGRCCRLVGSTNTVDVYRFGCESAARRGAEPEVDVRFGDGPDNCWIGTVDELRRCVLFDPDNLDFVAALRIVEENP